MNIEEAIKRLRKIQEEQEDMIITGKLDDDIFYDENVLKDFEKDNEAIETLLNEYEKQQDRINKAIELLEQELKHCEQEKQDYNICHIQVKIQKHLLKILKGE